MDPGGAGGSIWVNFWLMDDVVMPWGFGGTGMALT